MKRTIGAILFVIYSIIAITVTVLLLSFNEYNISEIGDYTVYIVKDDALEPKYEEGSILLIKNTNDKHVEIGDEIFYYKVLNSQEFEFRNDTLQRKTQQNGNRVIYNVVEGDNIPNDNFVGRAEDTIIIDGPWGTILSILESKWGYLFCIVIVSLLLFLQEVFDLVIELKYGGGKAANKSKKATTTKSGAKKTTTGTAAKTKATVATVAKTTTVAKENNTQTGVKEEE